MILSTRNLLAASRCAWLLAILAAPLAIGITAHGQNAKTAERKAPSAAADSSILAGNAADINDFEIACDKAVQVADDLESSMVELEFVRREKSADRKKIADLEAEIANKSAQASAYCQRAIELSSSKSNLEKLNLVRYMLSYFYYAKKQHYEAAVIGEFLARKYPDAAKARAAAQIALTSLDALYRSHRQAGESDLSFESGKLTNLANYILQTWPDQPEAGPAAELLMQFDLADGNFDRARETLARIPEDSRARADAELSLGHAQWTQCLRRLQELRKAKPSGGAAAVNVSDNPELAAQAKQAQKSLESGFTGLHKIDDPTERELLAVLSLAQLYLDQSQANKALSVLEDTKLGPLVLVKKDDSAARNQEIAAEIQRIGLLAYLGAQPPQLDKAVGVLDGLEKAAADADGKARVLQLTVGIAYELQQKLERSAPNGEAGSSAQSAAALKMMLDRVADRGSAADANTLIWLAEAYEKLAKLLNANSGAPAEDGKQPPETEAANRRALNVYEQVLARAKSEAGFLASDRLTAVRYRLAMIYRGLGNFDQATARLAEILKEKPTLLAVQIEAARTYQMRGAVDQPEYYLAAIQGGKGETAPIWGWGKLANRTSQEAKFRDTFHEARYNIALCRKLHAQSRPDSDPKKKQLFELAKDSIRDTQQFEATMGGEKWKPKYDALLRELQKQLDQPAVGLYEFENKSADTKSVGKS